MGRRLTVVAAALVVYAGVAALFFLVATAVMRGGDGAAVFGGRVAVVEVEGIILDVETLLRDLRAHRDNPLVRAVVVRINSPGGVVGPGEDPGVEAPEGVAGGGGGRRRGGGDGRRRGGLATGHTSGVRRGSRAGRS